MQVSRVLSRTCQHVVRSSVTRSVNPALQWRFSSTQAAAPATPAATEEIGWWSPSETKLKPIPKESEQMINEDGTVGEVIHKVVNVGGVRPDGRSPKWFTTTSTAHVGKGYTFLLDERGAQTQTEPLIVPSESLAVALSLEWAAQGKHILPDTLPLTRLVTMAIDQMPTSRDRIINNLMYTFDADLACVRIEEEVFAQQKKTFTPMIEWFAEKFGYKPKVSILFGKLKHPPQLVEAVREYLKSLDNFKLQALDHLTSATRSIILSLYLTHGKTGVEEGIKAARIEEDSQTSTWGVVVGTHDVDRTEISIRISVATLFWRLLEQK